jgi:cell wall-associated NlpC family hydrolase
MMKTLLLFFSILAFIPVFSHPDTIVVQLRPCRDSLVLDSHSDSLADAIIDYSRSFLKAPYRYGGRSKRGFDCSGFVSTVYKNFGMTLPRSSKEIALSGKPVTFQEIRKGDLLLFKNTRRRKGISHVGIVAEVKNGDVIFIHSATHRGVKLDYLSAPYYSRHYHKAIRLPLLDSIQVKP